MLVLIEIQRAYFPLWRFALNNTIVKLLSSYRIFIFILFLSEGGHFLFGNITRPSRRHSNRVIKKLQKYWWNYAYLSDVSGLRGGNFNIDDGMNIIIRTQNLLKLHSVIEQKIVGYNSNSFRVVLNLKFVFKNLHILQLNVLEKFHFSN